MPEIIIGKEGEQKFPIKGSRVSRKHAKLTVTDAGGWYLEDMNSTNGTYIINDNDELVEIKKVRISEFTRIVLGDQTAMGCTFFAHHVMEEDPDDYRAEFRYVMGIHEKALEEKRIVDEKVKKKGMLKFMPSILSGCIGLLLTCFLPPAQKVYGISATTLVTALLTAFINHSIGNDDKLKNFSSKYSQKLVCPHCGKLLTEMEFRNQMCASCKAHA